MRDGNWRIPAEANWVFHHPDMATCSTATCSALACVAAAAARLFRKREQKKRKAPAEKAPTGVTKKSTLRSTSRKARSPVPADPISSVSTPTATDDPLFRPCSRADNEDGDDDESMSDPMASSEFAGLFAGASGVMETS
jgi:hypothetical protein